MLPSHYACTGCGQTFNFAGTEARYCFNADSVPLSGRLSEADLAFVPVRPGWCKDCATVCLVEDIASIRAFEDAFGAVRAGGHVEYPLATEYLDPQQAQDQLEAYLRWRMGRRHPPRALCCGRMNYQLLDVAQPLLRHEECDFGVVEPRVIISSYNSPGPGVYSPANIGVYSGEGVLVGLLTWRSRSSDTWDVVPAEYPRIEDD